MATPFAACTACLRRSAVVASRWQPAVARSFSGVAARRNATDSPDRPIDAAKATNLIRSDPKQDEKTHKHIQRSVKKQLQYNNDPWKVAKEVQRLLGKDSFAEALLLVETISANPGYTVSWNHLIDYQFKAGKFKPAVKLFNDMKRRGQSPNAQTYTILFNGFARHNHPKVAVGEAFKHYNLLLEDRRLQPNSTHMNALLHVCSQAGDLESMFHIINTADEKTRAPTAFTYTIVLNALRHAASKDAASLSDAQRNQNFVVAVDRGKAIWSEVISKWSAGKTQVDEALVCSMGRLLLMSPRKDDKMQIASLLKQTMNLPDFTLKAGSSSSSSATAVEPSASGVFVKPGTNTLALVLKAMATTNMTNAGLEYWRHLVDRMGIVPDSDCWMRLFGMLKVGRSSATAASLIAEVPADAVNPRMYRIAMETCVRDNINENVLANARAILTAMIASCKDELDLHTLRLYLHTALVSHSRFRAQTDAPKNDAQANKEKDAKRQYALQITSAIDDLWEPYKRAHYRYFKDLPSSASGPGPQILYNEQREVIALARAMFSAYSKVVHEDMLSADELAPLKPVGAKINREIQAFYSFKDDTDVELPSLADATAKRGSKSTRKQFKTGRENEPAPRRKPLPLRQGGDFVWDTTKRRAPRRDSSGRRDAQVDKRKGSM